jgi:hypothetical protein
MAQPGVSLLRSKRPPMHPILGHMNYVHSLTFCFKNAHFNIILLNDIISSLIICTPHCSGDQIEKTEMGRACSTMGERRCVYRVLTGKPKGKRPHGRPRRRWEDNIKMCFMFFLPCFWYSYMM